MLKKTISYVDYNGIQRTEDFYFNLSKTELMRMKYGSVDGNFEEWVDRITKEVRGPELVDLFMKVISASIGRKSLDGKRIEKSETISSEFLQSRACDVLLMELLSEDGKASEFINGVMDVDDPIPVSTTAANGPIPLRP